MRRVCALIVVGAALAAAFGGSAQAEPPDAACGGLVVSDIASTWPWAHEGQEFFAPPPGGLAKWIDEVGEPFFGVSSVEELKEFICGP